MAITLLSSPMGEGLYSKLGFKVFGLVRMQVEGEIEALEYPVMAYEPESMYEDHADTGLPAHARRFS